MMENFDSTSLALELRKSISVYAVDLTLQSIPLLKLFLLFVVTGMQALLGMVKSS